MDVERLEFGPELWALVATEACHPVVGLFGSEEDARVAAKAKAEDGTELVQEPAVMPCLVEDGEVIVCNDFTVETHAQLLERLGRGESRCKVELNDQTEIDLAEVRQYVPRNSDGAQALLRIQLKLEDASAVRELMDEEPVQL